MRVAVVQTDPKFGETDANLREITSLAASAEADLYVLPELCSSGYNFVSHDEAGALAEEIPGPTYDTIAGIAREQSCYIVYGFAERSTQTAGSTDRVFNSSALVGPQGLVGLYRKVHLFAREKLFFAPGDLGFPVFDLPIGRIGMMVCFDWFFPESARALALKGAQLIAHPSNLVMPHCPDAMVTRCLENHLFTATANRIGTEDRGGVSLTYIGNSEIVSPRGTILSRLGGNEPGITVVDIDPAEADNKKINPYNDLFEDRRVGEYGVK